MLEASALLYHLHTSDTGSLNNVGCLFYDFLALLLSIRDRE